mgnify:CR=1 FL=1|tara:strand:- start:166 stop:795 length:630 start_codon:yes stop_codon:yes gene_type:complete
MIGADQNLKLANVNNPSFLNASDNMSVVSATLNNPFVKPTPSYTNFGSSDPVLNSILPMQVNLGITSPGYLDNAYECSGLDFINTNTNFDKLTFGQCLEKFGEEFQMPRITFNNFIKSLPQTFNVLSNDEKNEYIKLLQNFIDSQKINNKKYVKENFNNKENFNKKEYFGDSDNSSNCQDKNISVNGILAIVIIILLIIIFILFITKKN